MNRREFQNLALERLSDAQALLQARRYTGAYYLAGYAVECALKARIARQTKQHDFPPKDAHNNWIHSIATLLDRAGLAAKRSEKAAKDLTFGKNWAVVKDWTEEVRYQKRRRRDAEELLDAVTDFQHGVLPWLRKYW